MRYWIILVALVLTGCGQKGDLYIPKSPAEPVTTEVQPSVEPAQG